MKTNSFQIDLQIDGRRAAEFFGEHQAAVFQRTDRLFGRFRCRFSGLPASRRLFILTPLTWTGTESSVHPHVLAAFFGWRANLSAVVSDRQTAGRDRDALRHRRQPDADVRITDSRDGRAHGNAFSHFWLLGFSCLLPRLARAYSGDGRHDH